VVEESAGGGELDIVLEDESPGALGEVDCCLEQATMARALMHNKRRLRFIDHLTVCRGQTATAAFKAPGKGSTFRRKRRSAAAFFRPRQDRGRQARGGVRGDYFLAAMRFFFLAGSFGRDLPKEP
jgi:hypothetical protein